MTLISVTTESLALLKDYGDFLEFFNISVKSRRIPLKSPDYKMPKRMKQLMVLTSGYVLKITEASKSRLAKSRL